MNISIAKYERLRQHATGGETYAARRGPVTRFRAAKNDYERSRARDFARRPVIHLSRGMNHRATGSNRSDLPEADGSCVTVSLTYPSSRARRESVDRPERSFAITFFFFFFLSRWKVSVSGPKRRERERDLSFNGSPSLSSADEYF